MELTCSTGDLVDALHRVERAAGPRDQTHPLLGYLLLEARDKALSIVGTNLALWIRASVTCKVTQEGKVAVPARLFVDFAERLRFGSASLSLDVGQLALRLNSEPFSTLIKGAPADDYFMPPAPETSSLTFRHSDLFRALRQVAYIPSEDPNRATFGGVLLTVDGGQLHVVGSDSTRVATHHIPLTNDDEEVRDDVTVPAKNMLELGRLARDSSELVAMRYGPGQRQVFFDLGDSQVVTAVIEGEYPNYGRVLEGPWEPAASLSRSDLLETVRAVTLFSSEAGVVDLELRKRTNEVIVRAQSAEFGENVAALPAVIRSASRAIRLRGTFLAQALERMESADVSVDLDARAARLLLRGAQDSTFQQVFSAYSPSSSP